MSRDKERLLQTLKLLKWIRKYGGWWKIICDPSNENMNPTMMKGLIEKLAKEEFYEIILALVYIHKNAHFMKDALEEVFKELLIDKLKSGNKDEIIKKFLDYLN